MNRRSNSSARGAQPTAKRSWYRRRIALWLLLPGLLLAGLLATVLLVYMVRVPLPEDIAPASSTVFDAQGNEVGTLAGATTREDIALDRLPEHVPQAVLAAEDRDFYTHGGVSPLGIGRALVRNVMAGGIEQGGSTITQQYVKNAVVGTERTLWRKVKEAALAIKLDRSYDKRTILEWYLNTAYWGRGAQGLGAAAKTYFGTTADQLTLNQAATLAGMIQSPENLDPVENPDRADVRRRYVLDGMLSEGWITEAEHEQAVAEGLPETGVDTARATVTAPYYVDAVRRELAAALGDGAVNRGLRVHTALNTPLQQAAERLVRDHIAGNEFGADDLSGAVVSIDASTGEVVALVGGPNYEQQPFNVAVRGARQIGSTFKAFTLASFVEQGLSPETVYDAPAVIQVPDDEDGIHDYADQDRGRITVREATAVSANTVFVQMQHDVGVESVVDTAIRLGLPSERDGKDVFSRGSAMTLGVDDFTPLEVAQAYNTINTGGIHVGAHLIRRVEDAGGNVIWEPDVAQRPVYDTNDALVTIDTLKSVIESGTGRNAAIGRPAAGKTGTTQGGADGWFAGFTPQVTTVTWVGRVGSNEPVEGLSGGNLPARLWHDVMVAAMEGVEPADWPAPDLSRYEGGEPTETETEVACPEGWARGAPPEGEQASDGEQPEVEVLPGTEDDPAGPCVRPVEPSPTETETTPTETDTDTETPTESETTPIETPTVTPTEEPSESPTAEPSPTDDQTSGDGGGRTGEASTRDPSETTSPTSSETTDDGGSESAT